MLANCDRLAQGRLRKTAGPRMGWRCAPEARRRLLGPEGGDWVDCESCSRYSTNGISMAIAFAHNDAAGGCYPNFPEVITPAENHDWGTTDLFPTFGMPSCPGRNPHTDRSRAVTTGDLPPMAPPGTKRSLDRNVQLRLGGRLTTGINHPACWSRIWAQNTAKSIRTTATKCNKLDGSTSLTCRYETERVGEDRDRLAFALPVKSDIGHDRIAERWARLLAR
jgi:hypothetical protein